MLLSVARADLEQADALIIGSPKVGGAFATGGAASGGKENVITSLMNG